MSTIAPAFNQPEVIYPDSDGLPLSDNTKQFRWIMTVHGGLDAVFLDDPEVFVAGNLLWYPVKGDDRIRIGPDIFVVLGRPKGDRGSYRQWLEDNVAPQVAFEILSPGNCAGKLIAKFQFYDQYGVEEYYVYDPEDGTLDGWRRMNNKLTLIPVMNGWISPLLKVKFELYQGELRLYGPDGKKFATYLELVEQREKAQQRADKLAAQLKALGIEPEA